MILRKFVRAIDNAVHPELRAELERLLPLVSELGELDRSFVERINASKAARGEGPTKLRRSQREEVAGYAKDAEEIDDQWLRDFGHLPGESIVWALASALKGDVGFWSGAGLKHTHPADRHVVEATLAPKEELLRRLQELAERFPAPGGDWD